MLLKGNVKLDKALSLYERSGQCLGKNDEQVNRVCQQYY
jgi:hypothetical protein